MAFDVKGEYGALAEAFGATPVRLAPGGNVRLNPLDGRSAPREQAELVEALAGAALHRLLRPEERTALELALTDVRASATEPTLPLVVERLFDPSPASAAQVHTSPADLAASAREVALELRRLCEGALAGMFDGPTSTTVDFRSPLVVVDLSGVYHSPALPVVMTCVAAWLQAALAADDQTRRVVVVDEAWRMFSDVAIAAWMQQSFKLSRAFGTQNLLVMHRLSDLGAAGAAGSHQVRLVEGLLADAETRIIYAQPPSEVDRCRELLGLSDTEAALLPQLPRGQALWKVGRPLIPGRAPPLPSRSRLRRHRHPDGIARSRPSCGPFPRRFPCWSRVMTAVQPSAGVKSGRRPAQRTLDAGGPPASHTPTIGSCHGVSHDLTAALAFPPASVPIGALR